MRAEGGFTALAYVLTRHLAPALEELRAKRDGLEVGLKTAAGPGMGPQTLREDALEGAHP